jgi:hypothetical protein
MHGGVSVDLLGQPAAFRNEGDIKPARQQKKVASRLETPLSAAAANACPTQYNRARRDYHNCDSCDVINLHGIPLISLVALVNG